MSMMYWACVQTSCTNGVFAATPLVANQKSDPTRCGLESQNKHGLRDTRPNQKPTMASAPLVRLRFQHSPEAIFPQGTHAESQTHKTIAILRAYHHQ